MNKKKLLALLMALVMTLTLVPVTALAEVVYSTSDDAVAEVGGTYYSDLQEAIAVAMKSTEESNKTVNLLKNVSVDTWYQNVFATSHTTDGTKTNYVFRDGFNLDSTLNWPGSVTIDGNGCKLTVTQILSGTNGNSLFCNAENLIVRDLTITAPNGIGIKSGIIENVTFNMTGGNAIYTGANDDSSHIEIKGCTFKSTVADTYGIYSHERSDLGTETGTIISGNTFNTYRSVALRSDMQFLHNVVNSAKGVTIARNSTARVEGNYFKNENAERSINIYPAPQAVITGNIILGKIELEDRVYSSPQDLSGNYWKDGVAPTLVEGKTSSSSYYTSKEIYDSPRDNGTLFELSNLVSTSTAVAQIGNKKYETLEAAFAAAVDGDTINVLANCAGNGIKAPQGKFNNSGLTVNFAGFTYTVDGNTVGSTGTETNGFQLLKDNKITFTGGTISSTKAKILVQNYSDLTLEGMTLTLDNPNYTGAYTLSNNNGNVVIDGSTINANPAGGFAFDVCRYSSYPSVNVTVTGNSTINGDVEISASGSDAKEGFGLTLTSGTMTGNIIMDATAAAAMDATPEKVTITKASGFDKAAPDGYKWDNDGNLVKVTYVAQIGTTKYESLAAAIAAVKDDETIELLGNLTIGEKIVINNGKRFTLDLAGNTLTSTAGRTFDIQNAFVTVKNGTMSGSSQPFNVYGSASSSYATGGYNTLTLESNLTVEGKYAVILWYPTSGDPAYGTHIVVNGATLNGNIWVLGTIAEGNSVIDVKSGTHIYVPNTVTADAAGIALQGYATVNVENGVVISAPTGIEVAGGTMNISGGTITSNVHPTSVAAVNNGTTTLGAAIAVAPYGYSTPRLNITGGTIQGYTALNVVNPRGITNAFKTPVISVSGGEFAATEGGVKAVNCTTGSAEFITGGKFSSEPDSSYVADGYEAVALSGENEGKWQVGKVKATGLTLDTTAQNDNTTATYTATKSVVDEQTNANLLEKPETSFSVTVTAPTENLGSGKESIQLSNININEVVAAAVDKADEQSQTKASVTVQLAKDESAQVVAVDETTKKVTFEVHPEAIITVKDDNDVQVGAATTVKLSNDQIKGAFSFKLTIPTDLAAAGKKVTVIHKHSDNTEENLGAFTVANDHTITLTGISSFSEFIATSVSEGDVTVGAVGASLRRRVLISDHRTVVNTSTDYRVTFDWTDTSGNNDVSVSKSKLQWSNNGGISWHDVAINNTEAVSGATRASVVITGIPSSAFNTTINTRLCLKNSSGVEILTVNGPSYSVRDVADKLSKLQGNNTWSDYGKFLLGTYNIENYTLVREGEVITGHQINLSGN